ncbi:TetR/AcrR family transcriptional regulator [Nocardia sp. NBC_01327]|uniref:TetR/AcrR family transcriptional regulator n=1 Tax=Nocardia sp. NBC_01327 TaxID=2903593 RepID=UPI002E158F3B|nr:TetR/AcrR family transcriptional regulator [Nocardia sp. NBC_01327]
MAEPDRRVRRTRKTLHEAFIALVLDKGYENMTVQDILDRADIGRSTFYVHYRDKEALLTATFDSMRAQLEADFAHTASAGLPLEVDRPAALLFDHAHRNQRVYRALCGKQGGTVVTRHLHDFIVQLLADHLPHNPGTDHAPPPEVIAEFYAAATVGLLAWWIDHDFARDPTHLTSDFRHLATRGTRN